MAVIKQNIDWQVVTRKGVNLELLLISIIARGFAASAKKSRTIFGPLHVRNYRQLDTHRDFSKKEIDHYLKRAKMQELKKPGSILKSYYDYEKSIHRSSRLAPELSGTDWMKISSKQMAIFFKKYSQMTGNTGRYACNYYLYQYLGDELYGIIRSKEKNLNKQAEIFEILSQAKELSISQKGQKQVFLLLQKIKTKKIRKRGKEMDRWIENYLKKFGHMGFFYFRGKYWTRADLIKRINDWQKKDYERELGKLKILEKKNQNWLALAHKLKLSETEIILVKTVKQMTYCVNLLDEIWNYVFGKSQPMLKEAAGRLRVNYKELIEMDIEEIISYLREEQMPDESFRKILKERLVDSALIMINSNIQIISGQELKQYKKREAEKHKLDKNTQELKGQPASIGQARGKVVLVFDIEDLFKVKKGNIIVAKVTVPSFVPAMERAGAILTETGGLLSHAAIVSRELKIPCIVGIDRVTEILDNGDEVEVRADKGIVKILK